MMTVATGEKKKIEDTPASQVTPARWSPTEIDCLYRQSTDTSGVSTSYPIPIPRAGARLDN
jgi:hypothetical protein